MNKRWSMKRYLMVIYLVILSFLIFGCSLNSPGAVYSGTSMGDGSNWPGLVEIYLDNDSYDLDEEVLVNYSYGHAYSEPDDYPISHNLVIYLVDGYSSTLDPEEDLVLLEVNISGDDLMDESYYCDPGKMLWSDVDYNLTDSLSIDFNDYDIEYGLIVIRFSETRLMEDNIDEEIVLSEGTMYNQAFLYFLKSDDKIEFSRSSFA